MRWTVDQRLQLLLRWNADDDTMRGDNNPPGSKDKKTISSVVQRFRFHFGAVHQTFGTVAAFWSGTERRDLIHRIKTYQNMVLSSPAD